MKRRPRLIFYFLHLLGVGHVYRCQRLIEGFAAQGLDVDIVYGGERLEGVEFAAKDYLYLPPIKAANNAYSAYLDGNGNPLSSSYLETRERQLLDWFAQKDADAILFEAFPFGRRMVRHEIGRLLDAAQDRPKPPLIVSSVRDILQERKKQGRNEEVRDLIINRFDKVLVHSDPKIIPLSATFPFADTITNKIAYTGFVVPPNKENPDAQSYDILVSAGGGAFGGALMLQAMELAKRDPFPGWSWCLATGPNVPKDIDAKLRQQIPEHVSLVTRLDGLSDHMKKARISISQCGYNTAMDGLAARSASDCRLVFVPYDTEGQTEQVKRAQLLHESGHCVSLPQSQLTLDALERAMRDALRLQNSAKNPDFSGVETSARLLVSWLNQNG